MKKIDDKIIQKYLLQIDEDEYKAMLRHIIAEKKRTIKGGNDYQIQGKLIRFALSRGFHLKDIYQCVGKQDDEFFEWFLYFIQKYLNSSFHSHWVSLFLCHIIIVAISYENVRETICREIAKDQGS